MRGKIIFLNTDQSTKSVYKGHVDGETSKNLFPTLVNRRLNPEITH